jgi:hypothetical protein
MLVSLCTKAEEGGIEECLERLVAAFNIKEGERVKVENAREF